MNTKELVALLIDSLKLVEKYKDKISDAAMEEGLRRIQQHWRYHRPLMLHNQN